MRSVRVLAAKIGAPDEGGDALQAAFDAWSEANPDALVLSVSVSSSSDRDLIAVVYDDGPEANS